MRLLCGFSGPLPSRRTFNRFVRRLSNHHDLVAECMAGLTDQLQELLPGFGQQVAIDSTTVRSHSNPKRKSKLTGKCSDPEASWTAKNDARSKSKDGKTWSWGYKFHLVADANYGIPIYGYVTTASRPDVEHLTPPLDLGRGVHDWLRPEYVLADRGYDSRANHEAVKERGGVLICRARRKAHGALYEGIYTSEGVPTCMGMVEMDYVRSDPDLGHLYRCRREGVSPEGEKGRPLLRRRAMGQPEG